MKTVKTSTPMKPSMQMLCRLLDALTLRGLCLGLVFCFSAWSAAAVTPSAAATPAAALQKAVLDWVVQTQSVAPEAVTLAPLDPRLQVKACSGPLSMDLPFANPDNIRVRCAQPSWQLFVRVSVAGRVAAPSAPPKTEAAPSEKRQVLVAAVPLQRGMVLTEAHVRLASVDSLGMPVNVLEHVSQILHSEVVRDVRPDTPLRSQDIRSTVLVKRGQMVLMSVGQAQGFQISARVEAQQDGRFGEQIKLKNRDSGRILTGLVKGPNQVEGI